MLKVDASDDIAMPFVNNFAASCGMPQLGRERARAPRSAEHRLHVLAITLFSYTDTLQGVDLRRLG